MEDRSKIILFILIWRSKNLYNYFVAFFWGFSALICDEIQKGNVVEAHLNSISQGNDEHEKRDSKIERRKVEKHCIIDLTLKLIFAFRI